MTPGEQNAAAAVACAHVALRVAVDVAAAELLLVAPLPQMSARAEARAFRWLTAHEWLCPASWLMGESEGRRAVAEECGLCMSMAPSEVPAKEGVDASLHAPG